MKLLQLQKKIFNSFSLDKKSQFSFFLTLRIHPKDSKTST